MPTSNLRCAVLALFAALACAQPAAAGGGHHQVTLPCIKGVTCPKPAPHDCPNADATPASDNLGAIRRATLCLVNNQRVRHHLARLHDNRALRGVATRYARQMVAQRFFDHVSPAGTTFVQRIEHSTYLVHAAGWALGENLAWGEGSLATPREIVRAWMHSPGHRRNILDGSFSDAGMGVALGTPLASGQGATYANEFGHRG